MKSIQKIIICCGLVLAVTQSAIAAGTTAAPAAPESQAATKPGVVVIDREQLKKRLESRGTQAKKKRELAKQKALEQQNKAAAAGN